MANSSDDPLSETELAFKALEDAIDRHPKLNRLATIGGEPEVRLTRYGAMLRIAVKLKGMRGQVADISARGRTIDDALVNLVQNLDTWAVAMGSQSGS